MVVFIVPVTQNLFHKKYYYQMIFTMSKIWKNWKNHLKYAKTAQNFTLFFPSWKTRVFTYINSFIPLTTLFSLPPAQSPPTLSILYTAWKQKFPPSTTILFPLFAHPYIHITTQIQRSIYTLPYFQAHNNL